MVFFVGTLRKIKRNKQIVSTPMDPRVLEATFNRGFDDGVKAQREADIESLVNLLEDLESIPGIGAKRAEQLREYFLNKFGGWRQ